METELYVPNATTNQVMTWLRSLFREQASYSDIPRNTCIINFTSGLNVTVTEQMEDTDWTSIYMTSQNAIHDLEYPCLASEYFNRPVYVSDRSSDPNSFIEVYKNSRNQIIKK